MQQEDLQELVRKYLNGTATEAERNELHTWYTHTTGREADWIAESVKEDELLKAEMLRNILEQTGISHTLPVRKVWLRIAAAASIILGLSLGGYFILHKTLQPQFVAHKVPIDIAPGGNKAILTLANGQKLILTGAKNGKLAQQGNIAINKTAEGDVAYNGSANGTAKAVIEYNSMITPRGGQYHLTLADGTNVWLNAASSIKYPTAFTGNTRQVEITGEAYFEVAHNAAKPFRVVSNGQTVEVLGTHFNINAYDDEPAIKTTLLEGRVKVTDGNGGAILKPGEQAILKSNTISVVNTDVDDAIAWKNGFTTFDNADIYAVMRQIARWYDVKVTFEGAAPQWHFTGAVSRTANLSEVLNILKLSKVNFHVEGKHIIVTP